VWQHQQKFEISKDFKLLVIIEKVIDFHSLLLYDFTLHNTHKLMV